MILKIPGELPDLNAYMNISRGNKFAAAKWKKTVENDLVVLIRQQGLKPVKKYPVSIIYDWHCKDRRKDKRNISFGAKFVEDALQKAGIIRNDGWKELTDPEDNFYVEKWKPCIIVTIEERL